MLEVNHRIWYHPTIYSTRYIKLHTDLKKYEKKINDFQLKINEYLLDEPGAPGGGNENQN